MRPAIAAAAIVLIAGCGGVESLSFRTPPTTAPSSTTTAPADLTGAPVNGVGGRPTTSVVIGPGQATMSGIVLGPDGPVGGATVQVERFVGDAAGSLTLSAQADGTWTLPGILGGRYRVRAWRPPDLDMTTPQIFFLGATDNRSLSLELGRFNAVNVASAITPNPPVVGAAANLLIQLTTQTVDANGVVHAKAVASAAVLLAGGAEITVNNPNPATTTADGKAIWQVVCQLPGPVSLTATVNGADSYPVDVPDCAAPPTPSTTSTTTPTSSASSSSTTPTTTTKTTRGR